MMSFVGILAFASGRVTFFCIHFHGYKSPFEVAPSCLENGEQYQGREHSSVSRYGIEIT